MGSFRFWQKTYVLTLALCLVALFGGIAFIGWQNQHQTYEGEAEAVKREQQFIAQSLARDWSALTTDTHLSRSAVAQSYGNYYGQSGTLTEIRREDDILFSNVPPPDAGQNSLDTGPGQQSWAMQTRQEGRCLVVAGRLPGDFQDYTLICARSMEPLLEAWGQMQQTLLIGSAAVSVALALGLYFVLRSLSRPLENLAHVADEFAAGDFGVRAPVRGTDEVGALAKSFNAMADTAVHNIDEITSVARHNERMAANLSHEIRTPLTAIKGYAEYLRLTAVDEEDRESALAYIIGECTRLQKVSQRMLQLYSLESESVTLAPTDLAEAVRSAMPSVYPRAQAAGVALTFSGPDRCLVQGDGVLLESLAANLVDNAVTACGAGGKVQVEVRVGTGAAVLCVGDNGRGLTPEELRRIGEPLYRPDKARSREHGGAGLGIALCRRIAEAHRATIGFSSEQNRGTEVTVTFTAL